MLQRVQTIFLFGVSLTMGMAMAYYIWGEANAEQTKGIVFSAFDMQIIDFGAGTVDRSDDVVLEKSSTWYLAALAIGAAVISIISVLQFKNRLTQMKLGALNSMLMVTYLGICFYKVNGFETLVNPENQGNFQLGFFFPAVALVLNAIANRFIRKDEKLVKSVDRIR
ncbi:MAG: hypothetical protein ACJAS3_001824 [Roseivirga sp.]|jgi:hypothetical protein